MSISKELIDKVRQLLPSAKDAYQSKIVKATSAEVAIARLVTDRIAQRIADALAAGQDYAEVCTVHDFAEAGSNCFFTGDKPQEEQLFFTYPSRWKDKLCSSAPKPEWLMGAAQLIYAYCEQNDLRPKLLKYHVTGVGTSSIDEYLWSASKLIIRLQPEYLNKLVALPESRNFKPLSRSGYDFDPMAVPPFKPGPAIGVKPDRRVIVEVRVAASEKSGD